MSDTFDKPLDTDITETVEVERPAVVPTKDTDANGNPRFEIKTVKDKIEVTTRYTRVTPQFFSCKVGEHKWLMDLHTHVAKCQLCTKARFLRAVYETIREGHIVDRDTGQLID